MGFPCSSKCLKNAILKSILCKVVFHFNPNPNDRFGLKILDMWRLIPDLSTPKSCAIAFCVHQIVSSLMTTCTLPSSSGRLYNRWSKIIVTRLREQRTVTTYEEPGCCIYFVCNTRGGWWFFQVVIIRTCFNPNNNWFNFVWLLVVWLSGCLVDSIRLHHESKQVNN